MLDCTAAHTVSLLQKVRCEFRIHNVALFDVAATAVPLVLIARWMGIDATRAIAAILPLGIASHAIAGVETPFTDKFFDMDNHYTMKVMILLLAAYAIEGGWFTTA